MASQKYADHVIPELPLAQDLRVARRDHAAAQPICRRIIMLMSVTSKHSRTEFVRELDHELPRSVSAFDGEEIQKGEVEEEGLKDLSFHGELEGMEWCVRISESLRYSQSAYLASLARIPLKGID